MTQIADPISLSGAELWQVSRESYRQMADAGVFDRERVELIRGMIVQMAPMGLPHDIALMRCGRALRKCFHEDRFTVRVQMQFIAADESEPQPDLAVITGGVESIRAIPDHADLIVEISHSTLRYDRETKAALYAESGVADYWIVNLVDRVVEVYRNPHRIANDAWAYHPATVHKPGEPIDLLAMPGATIDPADLLPNPT